MSHVGFELVYRSGFGSAEDPEKNTVDKLLFPYGGGGGGGQRGKSD